MLDNYSPLFPPKNKLPYPFAFVNAPGCCGADIYWFPPKFPPGKIKSSIDLMSVSGRRIVIVLGRHFPSFVERICKGVGVITIGNHKVENICRNYGDNRTNINKTNITNEFNGYGQSIRRIHKIRKMSLGVGISKLVDKVYYMDSLYSITEDDIRALIDSLKKGEIVLATVTSNQITAREAIIKGGLRLIKETKGTHGDYYTLGLYYYRKNF